MLAVFLWLLALPAYAEESAAPPADGTETDRNAALEADEANAEDDAAPAIDPNLPTKEEVVYANLDNTGAVQKAYVVNIFNLLEDGEILDYGDYTSVLNLTSTEPLVRAGMRTSVFASAGRFYYQGNLTAKLLPWSFRIGYTLDGTEIAASELAGQSGALVLTLTSERSGVVDPSFAENYMLQISVTLDARLCKDIVAEGATPANAGNNRIYTFTVMPGSDANIRVSANVTNFTMTGVTINAVPFSLTIDGDIVDTGSFTGELTQLQDAIGQVNEGASALTEGIEALKNGCKKLRSGSSQFKNGLNELSANSGQLRSGSAQIADAARQFDGVMGSISEAIRGIVNGADVSDLPAVLRGTADSLESAAGTLSGAAGSLGSLQSEIDSLSTVDTSGVKATPEYAASAEIQSFVSQVDQQNDRIRSVRQSADATIPALINTLNELSGKMRGAASLLRSVADQIDGSGGGAAGNLLGKLSELEAKIQQLTDGIVSLDDGIRQYTYGVDQLADNYPSIHSGISGVGNGLTQLFGGAETFSEGTGQLAEETSGMDTMVEEKIGEVLSDFDKSDFVPVSFVSMQNKNVTEVQFVIKAEGVSVEAAPVEEAAPEENASFWSRLADLLEKYKIIR